MNYDDLFYFPKYNHNFIKNFKFYLSKNFKNVFFSKNDDHYLIILQVTINKLFVDDVNDMTLDTMSTTCIQNFEQFKIIKQMYDKVALESDFNPKITNVKMLFQYDLVKRLPLFMAEFTLRLSC